MLKRRVSPSKRPSMMRVGAKTSTLSQRNAFTASRMDRSMPKTRFCLSDRSSSSPRLKSFPAERIKRLEPSILLNSEESGVTSCMTQNDGQGDGLRQAGVQFHPDFRPAANQNISSISEQQVPRSVPAVSNQANQSELAIPSSMENPSIERPAHRPFVPNISQFGAPWTENSPKKSLSPRLVGSPRVIPRAKLQLRNETQIRHQDPWKIENDSVVKLPDCEPEPVRGRHAAAHRRSIEAHQSIQSSSERHQIQPSRSSFNSPNTSNQIPPADPTGWHGQQVPMDKYQGNMVRYGNHNRPIEVPRPQMAKPHAGMTSPQDIAVNQTNSQRALHQHGSYGWTTQPQSSWIPNSRPRIQPYSMDIVTPSVNVAPGSAIRYQYPQNGPQVPISRQRISANWQSQVPQLQHHQYYYQSQHPPATSAQSVEPPVENQPKRVDPKRKPLRFTGPMIRDQEMLVTTMRQQGIPEDIMRRQFEALLAEQRKQLLYLEQLERGDANSADKLQVRRRVQRKISRIEEDGKPEWMLHITPPRIPYSTIEKMRYEREVDAQQTTQAGAEVARTTGARVPQHVYEQTTQRNYQHGWQPDATGNWQQQNPHAYVCGNSNVANQYRYTMNSGITDDQGQTRYYGYPNSYYQPPQQYVQQVQENWPLRRHESEPREDQQNQRYQESPKTVEASSLLKLRLYKDVIRKQKQNNGLQDPKTVKEAMEALKNPLNRKGLEYLEGLNKKREKPLSLNGAQDPQENIALPDAPRQQYISLNSPPAKPPSANGLENQRNPNNPPPTSNLRQRKMENPHFAEYPRQRSSNVSRDCYSLMAERENGTVANTMAMDYQQHRDSSMRNPIVAHQDQLQTRSEGNFRVPGQMQQERKMVGHNSPMPLAFNEQNRPQFYSAPMQRYYGNQNKNGLVSSVNPHPVMMETSGFSRGTVIDENSVNPQQQHQRQQQHQHALQQRHHQHQEHQQNQRHQQSQPHQQNQQNQQHQQNPHYYYPRKNDELHEPITIGGIKYFARKPEYINSPSVPYLYREQSNPEKCYNSMIPCQ